jgi:hypothetical protein
VACSGRAFIWLQFIINGVTYLYYWQGKKLYNISSVTNFNLYMCMACKPLKLEQNDQYKVRKMKLRFKNFRHLSLIQCSTKRPTAIANTNCNFLPFLLYFIRSVRLYHAPGKPQLDTVLNGTKCGNNMVRLASVK